MNKNKNLDKEIKDNKYPISKNNIQCIGPCYEPGKSIIHPITMQFVTGTNINVPFCPTNSFQTIDTVTGEVKTRYTDACFKTTANLNDEQLQNNYLNPNINFDAEIFLKNYYNISSYDELLDYLQKNAYLPTNTKLRVIECMWIFNKDIFIIDNLLVEIFTDYLIDNIKIIYNKLFKYIDVESKKITFKKNNLEKNKFNIERLNFLKDKLVKEEEVNKFLNKYYEKNKGDKIRENIFQKNEILKNFINYLENKIIKSF